MDAYRTLEDPHLLKNVVPLAGNFKFKATAADTLADINMLCFLIEQHELKGTSFPEIGDKTLISKIFKGNRSLIRDYITTLAVRFEISLTKFFY